jgi:putative FmdB family regulatory protein
VPRYQYACTEPACGHEFEEVQSFSDPSLTTCPVCSGRLRKVFSAVGVVFKGSGFYRTDSRAGSGANASKNGAAKEAPASSASGSGSGSSDSSSSSSSSGSTTGTSTSTSSSTPSKAAAAS